MSNRNACGAALVLVLLAGCSALDPRVDHAAKRLDCDGSSPCTIVVTVDCLRYFACNAWADHQLVLVRTRNRPAEIRWRLEGEPGAEFATAGIVIDNSVFECAVEGRATIAFRDRHPEFGVFKYAINVTVKNSAFGPRGVPALDGWIVND